MRAPSSWALAFSLAGAASFAAVAAAQDPIAGGETATPRGALVRLGRPSLRSDGTPFGAVALSADGRLVAAADEAHVRVWSARTGSELRTFPQDRARALAFSPDGNSLAGISEHGGARVFSLGAAAEARVLDRAKGPVAWSEDGALVAVFAPGDGVSVFSYPGLRRVSDLAEGGPVRQLAFSTSGLGWVQQDGSVKLGSVESGDILRFSIGQGTPAAIDSSARVLAHVSRGGAVDLFDLAKAQTLIRLEGHPRRAVTQIAFSPAGDALVTGDDEGDVKVWRTDGDTALPLHTIHAHASKVAGVAFNGSAIATIGEQDHEVRVFSARTGAPARRGHLGPVTAVAYAADGRLATAGDEGTIHLWSPADRSLAGTLRSPGHVLSLAFAPGGKELAATFKDGTTRLLDLVKARESWREAAPGGDAALALGFLPAGDRLAVGMFKASIALLDAKSGERSMTIANGDGAARSLSVAPDGKLIAATNGILEPASETVNVLDVATGKKKKAIRFSGPVRSLAFAPDGVTLIAVRGKGTIELRDVRSGAALRSFEVELDEPAEHLAVSPDGRLVAFASGPVVCIHALATGDAVVHATGHRRRVNGLAFAPGSGELASASEDGSVVIWNTGVGKK